jgi:Virulence protein RhuM family
MIKRLSAAERMKHFKWLDKHYLYVDSTELKSDIEYVVKHGVESLMLIGAPYSTYNVPNIDWLESVSGVVKDIVITPTRQEKFSFEGLKWCSQLQSLSIQDTKKQVIDLSFNTNLNHLKISNYNKVIGVEGLSALESLVLTNKTPRRLLKQSVFDGFVRLKSLSLLGVKLHEGLEFLRNTPLNWLTIFNCRKPSLKGISDLKLTFLDIDRWKNSPDGRVLKSDVKIAKNYLQENEIKRLERTISGFFDYIENIIENRTSLTMEAFAESVNNFLAFNEFKVLNGKGVVSHKKAMDKASIEYAKFNKTQKIESDFDKEIKKLLTKKRTNT